MELLRSLSEINIGSFMRVGLANLGLVCKDTNF